MYPSYRQSVWLLMQRVLLAGTHADSIQSIAVRLLLLQPSNGQEAWGSRDPWFGLLLNLATKDEARKDDVDRQKGNQKHWRHKLHLHAIPACVCHGQDDSNVHSLFRFLLLSIPPHPLFVLYFFFKHFPSLSASWIRLTLVSLHYPTISLFLCNTVFRLNLQFIIIASLSQPGKLYTQTLSLYPFPWKRSAGRMSRFQC